MLGPSELRNAGFVSGDGRLEDTYGFLADDEAGLPARGRSVYRSYPAVLWGCTETPQKPRIAFSMTGLSESIDRRNVYADLDFALCEKAERMGPFPYAFHELKLHDFGGGPLSGRFRPKRAGPIECSADWGNSRAFPFEIPKGFTSDVPMSKAQADKKRLSGEREMSETVSRVKGASTVSLTGGPPNLALHTVRHSAQRLAEKRWKTISKSNGGVEPIDFQASLEWLSSIQVSFEPTGFNFLGDPPVRRTSRQIHDGPIADVAALLEEEEPAIHARAASTLEPLVWEDIDPAPAQPESPRPLSPANLELYQPPVPALKAAAAPPKQEAKAELVIEVKVEAPEPEPEMADRLSVALPLLHKPAAHTAEGIAEPLAPPGPRVQLPSVSILPLRAPMCYGKAPVPPKPPAEPAPKPVEKVKVEVEFETKPQPVIPVAAKIESPAAKTEVAKRKGKRNQKHAADRHAQVEEPIEEPVELSEEIEAELAARSSSPEVIEAQPEQAPAVEEPAPLKAPQLRKDPEPPPVPAPGSETESMPRAKEPAGLGLSAATVDTLPPPANSMGLKIGMGVVAAALIGGLALWQFAGTAEPKKGPAGKGASSIVETMGAVVGEVGWSTDWATDLQGRRVRQLSFYRPTMPISDYRVEFEAEVEYKAVSWVVRAANTKNYFVLKLNRTGPGAYNLLRFPVVDNRPGPVVEKPLPFPTQVGMSFRVRTDVVADRFSVTMQDKLVDEWIEKALPSGGFGVANEGAERGQVRTIQVWHLRSRTMK